MNTAIASGLHGMRVLQVPTLSAPFSSREKKTPCEDAGKPTLFVVGVAESYPLCDTSPSFCVTSVSLRIVR